MEVCGLLLVKDPEKDNVFIRVGYFERSFPAEIERRATFGDEDGSGQELDKVARAGLLYLGIQRFVLSSKYMLYISRVVLAWILLNMYCSFLIAFVCLLFLCWWFLLLHASGILAAAVPPGTTITSQPHLTPLILPFPLLRADEQFQNQAEPAIAFSQKPIDAYYPHKQARAGLILITQVLFADGAFSILR